MRFLWMLMVSLLLSSCALSIQFPSTFQATFRPPTGSVQIKVKQDSKNGKYLITHEELPVYRFLPHGFGTTCPSTSINTVTTSISPGSQPGEPPTCFAIIQVKESSESLEDNIPFAQNWPDHSSAWIKQWQPLLVSGFAETNDDHVTGDLRTVPRDNNDIETVDFPQVQYNGWLLYTFAGDEKCKQKEGKPCAPLGEVPGIWKLVGIEPPVGVIEGNDVSGP